MAESALIIGGDSAIGSAMAKHLEENGVIVHATSRRESAPLRLDLAQGPARWHALPATDTAYLCAASVKLDECENNPDLTYLVNVTRMKALAEILFAQGAYPVFLSTNQVFDGSLPYPAADRPVSPANEYGRQKAEFERWLMAQPFPAAVLRLTKVIAGPLPVLAKWSEALSRDKPVEAFTDLVFAPLPLANVLEAMALLGERKPRGIFQISGKADISYFDAARALATSLAKDPALVEPASAAQAGIKPQFLPRHGTLGISKLFSAIAIPEPYEALGLS